MLYSRLFTKTKKTSKDYDSANATLLIKAGFIDQLMSGVYTFLPLGLRVLNKIRQIVREEMDKIGQEVFLPTISPRRLWQQTDRLDKVDILFEVKGANKVSEKLNATHYILNCTHEEIITPLAQKFIISYKDFPLALYQIQNKFRNEARPKSGLLRCREFEMKDLYSFHTSEKDLNDYYEKAKLVYKKVFERCGLGKHTVIALASGGDFTDDYSHEFQTKCKTGEDTLFYSKKEDIYYNQEVAPSQAPEVKYEDKKSLPRKDVLGRGIIGVEELAAYLKIPVEKTTKTLLFETDRGRVIAAAVRGGYDINENKLKKLVGSRTLKLAEAKVVKRVTGAEVGYAGVLNLPKEVKVFMDESMENRLNFETGANKTHYHTINVNFGRDLSRPKKFYDIKTAKVDDLDPKTGKKYQTFQASEVGNIFPLYTKFTKAFNYYFTNQKGQEKPIYMGCYGIGTTRVMGVIVEKFHDNKGIIWPQSVAPFGVHLINLDGVDAQKIYQSLQKEGMEVFWDDRENVSAGEKFADADLIGIPVRLVVSKKTGDKIECKERSKTETELLTLQEVIKKYA